MERRARILVLLGAAAVAVIFLYEVRGVYLPFLIGILVTYATAPVVDRMEKRQVPRVVAISVVYALLAALAWLLILFVWPRLAQELNRMITSLPKQTEHLTDIGTRLLSVPLHGRLPAIIRTLTEAGARESQALVSKVVGRVVQFTLGIFSNALLIFLGPVVAFYLVRDLPSLRDGLISLFPASVRDEAIGLFREINVVLSGYIRGQVFVSSFVGVATGLGLLWLGIPYALLIGVLAGLFDVVPYFGPLLAGVPAVGLALGKSGWDALYVLLLLFAIHQFEGAVLVPRVIGHRTGLHPVAVIFALLAGGQVLGVMGMLIAVPTAAVLKVILRFAARKLIVVHPLS